MKLDSKEPGQFWRSSDHIQLIQKTQIAVSSDQVVIKNAPPIDKSKYE